MHTVVTVWETHGSILAPNKTKQALADVLHARLNMDNFDICSHTLGISNSTVASRAFLCAEGRLKVEACMRRHVGHINTDISRASTRARLMG